ncbi:MAG: queuosine precursor transporter [Kofleriaceae bacterium]
MKLDARLTLFISLVSVFMVCLVVGDLIGGKLTSFHLFGREWVFSVGQLAFPITFILTDILNEFYGRAVIRRVTFIAFLMVALTFGIVYAAGALPWAPFTTGPAWDGVKQQHFDPVFTQGTRIQLSSMVAFLIANMIDISVFFVLKRATGNRFLWLRATGSTAVSQLIDTTVITALAFYGTLTFEQYVTIVITSYLIKLTAAIGVTPIIYGLHSLIERKFGLEPVPVEAPAETSETPGARVVRR